MKNEKYFSLFLPKADPPSFVGGIFHFSLNNNINSHLKPKTNNKLRKI